MFARLEPEATWKVRVLANVVKRRGDGGLVFNDVVSYCLEFNGEREQITIDGLSREQAESLYEQLCDHLF